MSLPAPSLPPSRPLARLPLAVAGLLCTVLWLGLGTGCSSLPFGRPGKTVVTPQSATLPARLVSNFFVIEAGQADGSTRRLLIDTGSTATLVSADLARGIALRERDTATRAFRVRSANGGEVSLTAVTLKRLQLGEAVFERVPALIYDFDELSAHLGLKIDGLIGFPVFRDTLLTLDYPGARLIVAPLPVNPPPLAHQGRSSTIAFNNEQGTPFVPVQLGSESFVVLVDSGSDGALSLNPTGLHPRFSFGPRAGTIVSSLAGDREQQIGRVAQDLLLGAHTVPRPTVDLTDQLSSIGGELLRHFAITFDQHRNYATFVRESDGPVVLPPRRSSGLSFSRGPSYWRVYGVVPESPVTALGVQRGDLVVRINGEPVAQWDYERFNRLLATAAKITCTFLSGTREYDLEIPIFELVP